MEKPSGRLMTSKEVADVLGMKMNTLSVWRATDKGPSYIKIGNFIRYKSEDVKSFIEKGVVKPNE